MKRTVKIFLCAAVIVLSGCSSGNTERSDINIVDAGGHLISGSSEYSDSSNDLSNNTTAYISESTASEPTVSQNSKPSEYVENKEDSVPQTSSVATQSSTLVTSESAASAHKPAL